MFDNVELLINYTTLVCKEKSVDLEIYCDRKESGDMIVFKMTKNKKCLKVSFLLRTITLMANINGVMNQMDIHIDKIDKGDI